MSERVSIEAGPDGRPAAAVKRATGADKMAALRHEASLLELAEHPGIVQLVEVRDSALVTAFVGHRSLETVGGMTLDEAGALVAALATTVADLHDLGLVHGRLEPGHVLLSPDGQPVLCGLAGGGRAGEVAVTAGVAPPRWTDPSVPPDRLLPEVDVHGLGCLLDWLLERSPPGRRRDQAERGLRELVTRATATDLERRPTARALAASVRSHLPTPALSRTGRATSRLPRPAAFAVAMVAAVVLVAVGAAFALSPSDEPAETAESTTRPRRSAGPTTTTTTIPTTDLIWPTTTMQASAAPVVESGEGRFQLGEPGDQVAVGDWDCDDRATPALLRPATGEVFVFAHWAPPGEPITVSAAATVPGARTLEADDPDGDGCHSLAVETDDGRRLHVPLGGPP